jgi:hypothetical protein
VLFVILAQVPSLPPVLEAKQDWQVPPQAPLQHTLSIQFPAQHSLPAEQAVPLSLHVDSFTWPPVTVMFDFEAILVSSVKVSVLKSARKTPATIKQRKTTSNTIYFGCFISIYLSFM